MQPVTGNLCAPAYLRCWRSGELAERVRQALDRLRDCDLCPRACHANRLEGASGFCETGRWARVESFFAHTGEEDCIRGRRGSGTIFFGSCNLRCVFCQNFELSWRPEGRECRPEEITAMMLRLQQEGCHNINFVTPSHVIPQILETLLPAIEGGLRIPLVYNSSGYDRMDSLRLLDGVVDIYMPDFKFWRPEVAQRCAAAPDYPEVARQALAEMHRQTGSLVFDAQGVARRGVLLRHLVMPEGLADTAEIMRWVAENLSPETYVNVMAQYRPAGQVSARQFGELNRCLVGKEYRDAVEAARRAGIRRIDGRSAMGILQE
jgi:putative pyruvate formate lyase activating enzyme